MWIWIVQYSSTTSEIRHQIQGKWDRNRHPWNEQANMTTHNYNLSNVTMVNKEVISIHQNLRYCQKSGTIVVSILKRYHISRLSHCLLQFQQSWIMWAFFLFLSWFSTVGSAGQLRNKWHAQMIQLLELVVITWNYANRIAFRVWV